MGTIIGIDLGTTNSEVAVYSEGKAVVIDDEGEFILPSCVGLSDNNQLLVGRQARNQYVLYPERTVTSIKRRMGSDETVPLGNTSYSPAEISALILKELKNRAERYLGEKVERAVITVPALFTDAQRQATKLAGELAGLEVVRIINEPTAAALAYETDLSKSSKILVYDLGGGTFDSSLIQMQDGVIEVLASHGNNRLGGDDFDQKLLHHIARDFREEHGVDLLADRRALARLSRAVEEAKKHLSDNPFALIEEEGLLSAGGRVYNLSREISRTDYEDLIRSFIEETIRDMRITLDEASVSPRELDKILLVGGSTRIPLVSELIEKEFGIVPSIEVNPDLCVALGAAIQAALIEGKEVNRVLVDITPYSFGTSAIAERDGTLYPYAFVPVIKKGTALPCSRTEAFETFVDFQEVVEVNVFQGESSDALENILIGNFLVEGLSRVPAGNIVLFHMDIDIDGILHAKAEEKNTGRMGEVTIRDAFQAREIGDLEASRRKIQTLIGQVEDAGFEKAVEPEEAAPLDQRILDKANSLIERARRVLENLSPDDRSELIDAIERLKDSLNQKNEAEIIDAADELKEMLFYLD